MTISLRKAALVGATLGLKAEREDRVMEPGDQLEPDSMAAGRQLYAAKMGSGSGSLTAVYAQ